MTYQFEGILGTIKCTSGEWTMTIKAPMVDSDTMAKIATACQDTTILVTIDPVEEKTYGKEVK